MAKLKNIFYRLIKGIFYIVCVLLFILTLVFITLNIPAVKERIAKLGIEYLNNKFKTQISANEIRVDYLGNVELYGVDIKDHHNYSFIKAKGLKVYTNTFSLISSNFKNIKLDEIRLLEPEIRVTTYKGENTDNFSVFTSKFQSDTPSSGGFKLQGRLDLINGKFSIVNQNLPPSDQVWLDATHLNLKVSKVNIIDSDITACVEQFNFKGKRNKENYVINQLSGLIYYSDTRLEFKDLTLESDTSLLVGSLLFSYTKENGMSNFADKVNWNLDLKPGSKISGKDLRYFVKEWNSDNAMEIQAIAKGTLNNLTVTQSVLSGNGTFYSASSLILKDLVTSNTGKSFSIATNDAQLQTSYASLKDWLPGFIFEKIPSTLSNLGTANYKGSFSIDKNQIKIKGGLVSTIGMVKAEASLSGYSSKAPKYKGWAETINLNIAPFTQSSAIGAISSKINFEGEGFTLEQLNTKFDAEISSFEIEGKEITGITASGNLKNKLFDGKISTNDSHAVFDFDGVIDFSHKILKTDFAATIKKLDINYFSPSTRPNTFISGDIATKDIRFSNIGDLVGGINLKNFTLNREGQDNYFDNIQIKTTFNEGVRNLDIFSPSIIIANINGKFRLEDVPAMLQEGIGNLLVNYKPKRYFKNQEFSFVLDVQKNLFDLLMLDVNISPGTTITGRYTGENNQLQANLISEFIYYNNESIKLKNAILSLNTLDSLRQFTGILSSLEIGKTKLDNISFSGFKRNDSLFASIKFLQGKDLKKQTQFDLNMYQTRIGNDLIFGFKPSNIDLIQAKWTINPDFQPDEAIAKYNVITKKITLEKITARSDKAEIQVSGEYFSKEKYNFELDLVEVDLDKVIPKSLLQNMTFTGIAIGTAKVIKTPEELSPLVNLSVSKLRFNDQFLGDLTMQAIYSSTEKKYFIDSKLVDNDKEKLTVRGYIENVPNNKPQVNVDLQVDEMNMAPIGTFLQDIFSNFRGYATGNVQITGNIDDPDYQGVVNLDKVGMRVNFLGVDYQLARPQDLQISKGVFFFDNMELEDDNKNKGYIYGALLTKNFSDWGLDIDISSEKIKVLDTSMEDNDLFYGTVYARGNFSLYGSTVKGIRISAEAEALNSSLTINSSSTTNATDVSFIKFYPHQVKEAEAEKKVSKPPLGLEIHAEVSADENSEVNLIINQQTGDRIQVRGKTDQIVFDMSSTGGIKMDGKYVISGNSKYFYQIVVNKEFDIEPESTIIWEGKGPTDAVLNITANYTRPVSNLGEYVGMTNLPPTDVTIKALLTGTLSSPDMKFSIDANASSSVRDLLKTKLNNNPGEVYNQVASLVVFSTFLSDKMGGNSYASSAYDVVLKQLTNIINNISGNFFLNASFNAGSRLDNTSNRISLDPTFKLNRRLSVIGSVNVPLDQRSEADVWTYGARIDYDISKEGNKSLILSGFSKPSTFGQETSLLGSSGANNQAYGAGILYKKSFKSFKDLFKKKVKNNDSILINK